MKTILLFKIKVDLLSNLWWQHKKKYSSKEPYYFQITSLIVIKIVCKLSKTLIFTLLNYVDKFYKFLPVDFLKFRHLVKI